MALREYLDGRGRSPFGRWFAGLDREAAAEVTLALVRLEQGYRSRLKALGGGVVEYRIDFGPGDRVYFGRADAGLIVLLGGGTKQRQSQDIRRAKRNWRDYRRSRPETWH